uniref:Uncharacterized protein n=1 Tax=Haptolina brevifila TaxID=156173 RepID=A0A7S2INB4_9EUKA|mmetsp:Transcript_68834/g.136458  ORF Transcript_68834/g.136458 Transcript_68834/m.136458 type:complete len:175 (+) Transcript_68834:101-625(+)
MARFTSARTRARGRPAHAAARPAHLTFQLSSLRTCGMRVDAACLLSLLLLLIQSAALHLTGDKMSASTSCSRADVDATQLKGSCTDVEASVERPPSFFGVKLVPSLTACDVCLNTDSDDETEDTTDGDSGPKMTGKKRASSSASGYKEARERPAFALKERVDTHTDVLCCTVRL